MFFRTKTSGPRTYLQIVENRWEEGAPGNGSSPPWDDSTNSSRLDNSTPC